MLFRSRHLHWDFRLEHDGVLKSWAIPKGPSLNPADKRLAIQVEDHSLEYGNFSGIIPPGEYGAGEVLIWDCGTFEPIIPMDEGLASGNLLLRLHGVRLHGTFALVRFKRDKTNREWLLIARDEHA